MVTYLYNWKTTITTGSSAFLIQDHLRRLVAGVAAPNNRPHMTRVGGAIAVKLT